MEIDLHKDIYKFYELSEGNVQMFSAQQKDEKHGMTSLFL